MSYWLRPLPVSSSKNCGLASSAPGLQFKNLRFFHWVGISNANPRVHYVPYKQVNLLSVT